MRIVIILFSLAGILSCSHSKKTYQVYETRQQSTLDKKFLKEDQWDKAKTLSDFSSPWQNRLLRTPVFQALHNDSFLYCKYTVVDSTLVISSVYRDESDVPTEDRIEIYFSKDRKMKRYFCIEVDPLGRILDYKASSYRRFDNSWDFVEIASQGVVTADGYSVELSIPIKALHNLGVFRGESIFTGLYVADLEFDNDSALKESWITWVNPGTNDPDFHVPESLGILTLHSGMK